MAITSTLFEDSYLSFLKSCKRNVMDKIKCLEEDKVNIKYYVQKLYIIASNKHRNEITLSTEELDTLHHNLMLQLKYHNVIDRLLDKYKDLFQMIH